MVSLCYLGFVVLSLLGALCDFLFYRIPNFVVLGILVGGILKLFLQHSTTDFHLIGLIFIVILLTGYLLYAFNFMGAGDAKFLSASILWIAPQDLYSYFALVALAGGGLALICLFGHKPIDFIRMKVFFALKEKLSISETSRGIKNYFHLPFVDMRETTWTKTLIPYGIAIFVGNLVFACLYLDRWGFK